MLKLSGSWRAKEREKAEPKSEPGVPPRPAHLDGDAAEAWDHLIGVLSARQVLTLADARALELLCETWGRYRQATRSLAEDGITIKLYDRHGKVKQVRRNPASGIQVELARLLRLQLAEFGLTPASRTRVAVLPGKEQADGGKGLFSRSQKRA